MIEDLDVTPTPADRTVGVFARASPRHKWLRPAKANLLALLRFRENDFHEFDSEVGDEGERAIEPARPQLEIRPSRGPADSGAVPCRRRVPRC